jgi:hypothetical protein
VKDGEPIDQFSLLGGPLHRLGCRLGLVRHGTNTVLLGIVMGTLPWLVMMLLLLAQGKSSRAFSLDVIGIHVRLLVAIPLLFLCESALDPQIRAFASYCVRSGVVSAGALPAFEAEIARVTRWKNAWLPEAACLVAAALMAVAAPQMPWGAETDAIDPDKTLSVAGWWYWIICLPLFRFLMFRWAWRLALWFHFLWRFSRLELHLMPAHADRTGGLGNLQVVHTQFAVLVMMISAILSASFAEEIVTGGMPFDSVYLGFVLIFLAGVLLFLLPLCVFVPQLRACKRRGLHDYMELAARYATDFNRKWIIAGPAPTEPLLGTPDLQSLADIATATAVVREMRSVPISALMLKTYLMAALLPLLPLLLLKYPVAALAQEFFRRVVGL